MAKTAPVVEETTYLVGTRQVAQALKVTQRRVQQMIGSGQLHAYGCAGRWLIDPRQLTDPKIRHRGRGRPRKDRKVQIAPRPGPVPAPMIRAEED